MVFSIPGATTCCRIRIARVVPRGYDPIVGELRRSDPYDDHYVPPPRHGLRAIIIPKWRRDDWVDPRKKKRKREKNSGICLISSSVVRFPRPSRRPIGGATGGGRRMLTRAIIKFEWERLESACNCLLFDPPVPIKRINELIVTAGRPRLQRISKFCFITGWILESLRSRGSKIERI